MTTTEWHEDDVDSGWLNGTISEPVVGPTGPPGPAGAPGGTAAWRGTYDAGTVYAQLDAVDYQGSSFVNVNVAGSTGVAPVPGTNTATWQQIAAKGATGATGPAGPTGPTGPTGPAGTGGAVLGQATGPSTTLTPSAAGSVSNITSLTVSVISGHHYRVETSGYFYANSGGSTNLGVVAINSTMAGFVGGSASSPVVGDFTVNSSTTAAHSFNGHGWFLAPSTGSVTFTGSITMEGANNAVIAANSMILTVTDMGT